MQTAFESRVVNAIKGKIPSADVRQSFRNIYGGVSMTLPANAIGDLLSVDGVVSVQQDSIAQPLTDVTPAFLGATQVWPSIGGPIKAGEGVIVGVLDTGIWPEHPSWVDHGLKAPPGGPFACTFGVAGDPPFACNNKLAGAYVFLAAYAAGIVVNASAGNSGPAAATAEHAGGWTNTVGASTSNRSFLSTLHLTASNGDKLDLTSGVTVTAGIATPTDVVVN